MFSLEELIEIQKEITRLNNPQEIKNYNERLLKFLNNQSFMQNLQATINIPGLETPIPTLLINLMEECRKNGIFTKDYQLSEYALKFSKECSTDEKG